MYKENDSAAERYIITYFGVVVDWVNAPTFMIATYIEL